MLARHRTGGPLLENFSTMPVSRQTESRLGPSHCGQSSAKREVAQSDARPHKRHRNLHVTCIGGVYASASPWATQISRFRLWTLELKMAVMAEERLDTNQKALRINLDARRYGTFAEIGAGQEVARWFFRVGSAAGTVAKTISAYDMAVSDAIYGPPDRYVSRQRLQAMLGYE